MLRTGDVMGEKAEKEMKIKGKEAENLGLFFFWPFLFLFLHNRKPETQPEDRLATQTDWRCPRQEKEPSLKQESRWTAQQSERRQDVPLLCLTWRSSPPYREWRNWWRVEAKAETRTRRKKRDKAPRAVVFGIKKPPKTPQKTHGSVPLRKNVNARPSGPASPAAARPVCLSCPSVRVPPCSVLLLLQQNMARWAETQPAPA